jgi:AcrR family transcriptional regulator
MVREEIKNRARQQMAEQGHVGLSLSAIARGMELTTPAMYRYYASRDDLISALIVDAYNSFADALDAASKSLPERTYASRLTAVCLAYRDWAIAHKTDFGLIYGTPIPGYEGPPETSAAAQRGALVLTDLFAAAVKEDAMPLAAIPDQLARSIRETIQGYEGPPEIVYRFLSGWARLHGMVMLEVYNQTAFILRDTEGFYRQEVAELVATSGIRDL